MYKFSYRLFMASILISLFGCVEMPAEIEDPTISSPAFSTNGQIIGKKINQAYTSDLSSQELCGLFSKYTPLPIVSVSFEEEAGYSYLRAFDGTANYYLNIDIDSASGELRLLSGGKRCAGEGCTDCALKGVNSCVCDGSGDDSNCKYSELME